MNVTTQIDEIRQARWAAPTATWGLVPTMGFLHAGHLSLIRQARAENDFVAVSIFVNPLQFNNASDLEKYPRNEAQDLALLKEAGVDLVWTPTPEIAYPADFQTQVTVSELSKPLEGAHRPGHFAGVTTVVAKLFNIFQPTRTYFGQKDAQQVAVIQRMVKDLIFILQLVVGATVREADGLALSSRNARLSAEGRRQAVALHKALQQGKRLIEAGEREAGVVREGMTAVFQNYPLAEVEYISLADADSLQELTRLSGRLLISMAVFVDGVRLIDNLLHTLV